MSATWVIYTLHMSSPWGVDLPYMWIVEIRRKNFFPLLVQDFWKPSCHRLLIFDYFWALRNAGVKRFSDSGLNIVHIICMLARPIILRAKYICHIKNHVTCISEKNKAVMYLVFSVARNEPLSGNILIYRALKGGGPIILLSQFQTGCYPVIPISNEV